MKCVKAWNPNCADDDSIDEFVDETQLLTVDLFDHIDYKIVKSMPVNKDHKL